jgi:hypothetical protein
MVPYWRALSSDDNIALRYRIVSFEQNSFEIRFPIAIQLALHSLRKTVICLRSNTFSLTREFECVIVHLAAGFSEVAWQKQ